MRSTVLRFTGVDASIYEAAYKIGNLRDVLNVKVGTFGYVSHGKARSVKTIRGASVLHIGNGNIPEMRTGTEMFVTCKPSGDTVKAIRKIAKESGVKPGDMAARRKATANAKAQTAYVKKS